jgi:hypothetical protein
MMPYRPKRQPTTFQSLVEGAIAATDSTLSELIRAGLLLIRIMMLSALCSSFAAGIGFWLTYWSPFTTLINSLLTQGITVLPVPMVLQPALLVFACAGIGLMCGLTQMQAQERRTDWPTATVGSLGWAGISYAIAWISWQWAVPATVPQAITRLAAVIAFCVSVNLGSRQHPFLRIVVATVGTSLSFIGVQQHLWQPGAFLNLFRATNTFLPDQATLQATLVFFGLLAIIISSWMGFSASIVEPSVEWINQARRSQR